MKPSTRQGFTLIELLVVIAIIAVLIALLLPAVQQAREAARRSQCKNNFKQIALAMHNYESTYGCFPAGFLIDRVVIDEPSFGWAVAILPYLDQAPLYNQLMERNRPLRLMYSSTANAAEKAMLQTPIAVFRCPTDTTPSLNELEKFGNPPIDQRFPIATSNYVAYCGNDPSVVNDNGRIYGLDAGGVFFGNSFMKMRDMTDGTSNTLIVGERDGGQSRAPGLTFKAAVWAGTGRQNNNGSFAASRCLARANSLFSINFDHGFAGSQENLGKGASSLHEGGIQAAMGDGSVRFLSENINNMNVYVPLVLRDDGKVVGEF